MTPNIDFKSDGHVHTAFCHHAVGQMEDYVHSAIAKGLDEIIFLEHFETGIVYFESTWLTVEEFERYFEDGHALKIKYKDQISVGLGVEVGYNPRMIEETVDFLQIYDWDRIGISCHFYEYRGKHINLLSRKQKNMDEFSKIGVEKVVSGYLKALMEAVTQLPGNVLCHLDAVLRYHADVEFTTRHNNLIDELLSLLAAGNIALEVNTSGYEHPRRMPYPYPWIIKKANELGIQCVLGSDAHHPNQVGRHFNQLKESLQM